MPRDETTKPWILSEGVSRGIPWFVVKTTFGSFHAVFNVAGRKSLMFPSGVEILKSVPRLCTAATFVLGFRKSAYGKRLDCGGYLIGFDISRWFYCSETPYSLLTLDEAVATAEMCVDDISGRLVAASMRMDLKGITWEKERKRKGTRRRPPPTQS